MNNWPSNDTIAAFKFNDVELDAFTTNFNYYARAQLIMYKITKADYLQIEDALKIFRGVDCVLETRMAKQIFIECLSQ